MQVDVLGVKIDDVSLEEAVSLVKEWVAGTGKHYVVTPNPEFIMAAQKDKEFKDVLNKADLAIPDGIGLKVFAGVKNLVGGVYLVEKICRESRDWSVTIGFLGGQNGVAKRASECLEKKYPGLKIAFAQDGPTVGTNPEAGYKIKQPVDILFVGFGHIKQEKWIAANLSSLPVKVALGIGGSFDEIAGKVPMAPEFIHKLGLKWLFRLIVQPWRFKRQLKIWQFAWKMIH